MERSAAGSGATEPGADAITSGGAVTDVVPGGVSPAEPSHEEVAHAVKTETHRALKNGLKLALSMGSTLMVAFAVRFWLPRVLGPELFGQTHFSDSFALGWFAFTHLGTDAYLNREVAVRKEHASEAFGSLLIARAVATVIVVAGIALTLHAMDKPRIEWEMVYIFGVGQALFVLNASLSSMLQAVGTVNELAVSNVSTKLLWGAIVLGGVSLGGGIRMVAVGFMVSEGVRAVSLFRAARKHLDLEIRLHLRGLKAILIACIPYFLHAVAHRIYASVGTTMISWLVNDQEVGWYGAAINVTLIALLVIPVLQSVILPMGVRIAKTSVEALNETMRAAIRIALIASVPMALLMALNAKTFVHVLYRDSYAPSTAALGVLGLLIPLTCALTVGAVQMLQHGRIWTLSRISIFAMVLNPTLNWFLIPYGHSHWGLGGAGTATAISTVFTEIVVAILTLGSLGRAGFDRATFKLLVVLSAISAALAGVHFALPPFGVGKIVVEGIIYCAIAIPLGALPIVPVINKVAARVRRKAA